MKICIIAPIFEPWNKGGDGKYTSLLAHGFSKEHEVVVITTPGPSERKSNQMESNLRIIELKQSNVIPYYFYNKNDPPVGFGKRMIWHLFDIWNFSVYRQIKKILEKEKPDIVHTNAIKGISSSVFSAVKSSKIPHVYTIHDYELISRWVTLQRKGNPLQFNLFDRIYSNYMRNISSSVSSVIFPAQHIKDLFLKKQYFKNSKSYMINHGIKIKENVQPKNGTAKNFMYLGRLHKSKGIDLVIRAFKKVKKKDIALHIVGEGAFLNELKKIAGAAATCASRASCACATGSGSRRGDVTPRISTRPGRRTWSAGSASAAAGRAPRSSRTGADGAEAGSPAVVSPPSFESLPMGEGLPMGVGAKSAAAVAGSWGFRMSTTTRVPARK